MPRERISSYPSESNNSNFDAWSMLDTSNTNETIPEDLDNNLNVETESAVPDTYTEYENELPTREKIPHPEKLPISERDELLAEKEEQKKAVDVELQKRRDFKESNKYDNVNLSPSREFMSEVRANLPVVEEHSVAPEHVHKAESLESKVEKMYNSYAGRFVYSAPKWLSFGISTAIERGNFDDLPTDSLVMSGFWSREQDEIHDKLDPEDTMSMDAIDAERSLKVHVARDLIGERSGSLSESELRRARYKGSLYSIYSGARLDERTKKVIYAIPPEKGDKIRDFMENADIDFQQFGESARARRFSYQGFANIIDAIKDDNEETERGFKALDWYFDSFGYGEKANIGAFLGELGAYEEVADDKWKTKYDEYLSYRKEVDTSYEDREKTEEIPVFKKDDIRENISVEELRAKLKAVAGDNEDRILQMASANIGGNVGERKRTFEDVIDEVEADQYAYIDVKKLYKIIDKYEEYQRLVDLETKIHTLFWIDNNTNKTTHYVALEYSTRGQKAAIIAPYEANSSNASYSVFGVDWRDAFVGSQESKLSVAKREGVTKLYHRANMKQGRDSIENMWYHHERNIDRLTRNVTTT